MPWDGQGGQDGRCSSATRSQGAWAWHPAPPFGCGYCERTLPSSVTLSKSFMCHQRSSLAAQTNCPLVPRTVLLLNRSEVQSEFLSIAEKLSASEHPQHATLVVLLEHLYQANFGTRCDLDSLHRLLKVGLESLGCGGATVPLGAASCGWLVNFLTKIIFD